MPSTWKTVPARYQIEQIPRKTFSRLLPISPPPSDLSRLIHPVASIVSLFKAGGILSPHLWTRHHIRKWLLLCLNFANCSIKTSHNRGQIYSNKVVSYCYFRGNWLLSGFSTKLAPFRWVTLDHILHSNTARYKMMFCTDFRKLIEKTFRSCLSMDVIDQIVM